MFLISFLIILEILTSCGRNEKEFSAADGKQNIKTGSVVINNDDLKAKESPVVIKVGSKQQKDFKWLEKAEAMLETENFRKLLETKIIRLETQVTMIQKMETLFVLGQNSREMRFKSVKKAREFFLPIKQVKKRPMTQYSIRQGYLKNRKTERFQIGDHKGQPVDILLVVDTTKFMTKFQEILAKGLNSLLSRIKRSNWRIAIVSMKNKKKCYQKIIYHNQAYKEKQFRAAVQFYNDGFDPAGFLRAVRSLDGSCSPHNHWLRKKSALAIIFFSQSDNCTNGKGCGRKTYNKPVYLSKYLKKHNRTLGVDTRIYGIFSNYVTGFWDSLTHCAFSPSIQYKELVDQSHGVSGSICDEDYSKTLRSISSNISSMFKDSYELTFLPNERPSVYINGRKKTFGWKIHRKSLSFLPNHKPYIGSTIKVKYNYPSRERFRKIHLPKKAVAKEFIDIFINGEREKNFEYENQTNAITFHSMPAENALVNIIYEIDTALPSEFSIALPKNGQITRVTLDGDELSKKEYRLYRNEQIIFRTPPKIGITGRVYYLVPSPASQHPYSYAADQKRHIAIDFNTNQELKTDYYDGSLFFKEDALQDQTIIRVFDPDHLSDEKNKDLYKITLPVIPIQDSVLLRVGENQACRINHGLKINGANLDITHCSIKHDEIFTISYEYKQFTQFFKIDREFLKQKHQYQVWRVFLDGEAFEGDYQVSGNHLLFFKKLPEAKIEIMVSLIPYGLLRM